LFKRSDSTDDDTVSLADDNHAWWAGRDELQRAFGVEDRVRQAPPTVDNGSTSTTSFTDQFSTDSLFNGASSPEPDDPTHGGTGLPLDPYRVLGLQPGASLSEVVSAHRSLAKRYHPDQMFDADEDDRLAAAQTMSTINSAYHELRSRLLEDHSST
jgi:DnaJ-domain-containing protein 1